MAMAMAMASLVMVPPSPLSWCSPSISSKLRSFNPPHRGLGPFPRSNGLSHLGISITQFSPRKARKGKCRRSGVAVRASFFGVGAPEALVIGVVALLVFGPKGLAEAARSLGKTLRAFQPTIRELQDVSRDFKSNLEREIGLDEISSPRQSTGSNRTSAVSPPPSTENPQPVSDVNGAAIPDRALTTEEYLKLTEEQLKAAALQEQQQQSASVKSEPETESRPRDKEAAEAMPPPIEPEKYGK